MTKMQLVEQAINKIEETATPRQKEATKLLVEALSGDVSAKIHLMEGISTSDIPTLLTPAINVTFLAKYAAQTPVWDQIAQEYMVPSFGEIKFGDFNIERSIPPLSPPQLRLHFRLNRLFRLASTPVCPAAFFFRGFLFLGLARANLTYHKEKNSEPR